MNAAKKKPAVTGAEIFIILLVCVLWGYYRLEIIGKIDEFSLSLIGKTLTGRNPALRITVMAVLFLISVLLPLFLGRLIGRKPEYRAAADALFILILSIPWVQLLIICANQVLRRDDYWEIADARMYGFPGSMFYEIRQWNGRYTGWGLKSLHAVLPDIPYIDIFLFADLVLLTAAAAMLVYRFLKYQAVPAGQYAGMKLQAACGGFLLALSFVLMSSNIWEFWFWGSGTRIYGFGITMCLLSTALVLRASDEAGARPVRKMLLPALTCFLTCGCSELCTASLCAFLLAALIWRRVRSGKWDKRILFFLAEIILLTAGIFLLSGSLKYAGGYAHAEDGSLISAGENLISRLPGVFYWAYHGLTGYTFIKGRELVNLLFIAFLFGTQLRFDREKVRNILILAVFFTVLAYCVLLINTVLDYMPPRVVTVGICWFFTAMALLCVLLGSLTRFGRNNGITLIFCAVFLALSMNVFYHQNIDDVRAIRGSWYIRDLLLKQADGSAEAVTTCSLPCPGSFREDIPEDPEDPFSEAAARYYNVPAVSADHRCPPYGEYFILPEEEN